MQTLAGKLATVKWRYVLGNSLRILLVLLITTAALTIGFDEQLFSNEIQLSILNFVYPLGIQGEFADDTSLALAKLILLIAITLASPLIFFIISFRLTGRFVGRFVRVILLAIPMIAISLTFIYIALVSLATVTPDADILIFLSDITSELGTEMMGAFLLFILLDFFAKTWEENEEAEYANSTQNSSTETDEKLKIILEQWQQQQLEYSRQAKSTANQSLWGRIFSPQKMPSAYYEGQASALSNAIQEMQQIIAPSNDEAW